MNEPHKTIVLVDGFDDGHHLTHLRNYAQVLLGMGHRVLMLLPDPAAVEPWLLDRCPGLAANVHAASYRHERVASPSWRLKSTYEPLAAWRRAGHAVRELSEAVGLRPDVVFFCWLDDYIVGSSRCVAWLLPLVFRYRWSGLFFHPWHLRIPGGETRSESQAAEVMLRSSGCAGAGVLDAGIVDALSGRVGKRVVLFPDETEERLPPGEPKLVRQLRAQAAGRKVVCLAGNLSRRKGVISLLAAAAVCRERPWLFLFAGAMGEDQLATFNAVERQQVLEAARGAVDNVCFLPGRIEDEREFNAVIASCDLLYAAYEMFAHSSGIVTKAGFLEKPIIVSKGYYMEEVVRDFRLGLAIDSHRTEDVVRAIETLLDPGASGRETAQPDYARFRKTHSIDALGPAFTRVLEEI